MMAEGSRQERVGVHNYEDQGYRRVLNPRST